MGNSIEIMTCNVAHKGQTYLTNFGASETGIIFLRLVIRNWPPVN